MVVVQRKYQTPATSTTTAPSTTTAASDPPVAGPSNLGKRPNEFSNHNSPRKASRVADACLFNDDVELHHQFHEEQEVGPSVTQSGKVSAL